MKLGKAMQLAKGQNWLTNQYYDYIEHRNTEAERDAIKTIMTRPERIRENSWSASAAGSCLRQRQFTYLGMPKKRLDEKSLNIFANGDYVHIRHQAFGMVAGYLTEAEVPVRMDELNLLGTMDGMLSNDAIAEFKSINNYGFSQIQSFGAKGQHVLQVHSYFLATGRDQAHVVYENKDTNILKEFVITRNNRIIDEVVADLVLLNSETKQGKLLPMLPECRRMEGQYNWCPYAKICEDATWPTD